jgi:hypothetical protein
LTVLSHLSIILLGVLSKEDKMSDVSIGKRIAGIVGGLSFFIGFILAVVSGIVARDNGVIVLILVILGVLVAVLNITAKEVMPVMIAAIALIVAGGAGIFNPLDSLWDGLGRSFNGIVTNLAVFMVPVAIISAIRAVIVLARPGD